MSDAAPGWRACAALLLAAAGAGCASTHADALMGLAPRTLAEVERSVPAATPASGGGAPRPVVALVLGGGGLRGFAHLGVLRALEEAGIRPDIVVGTSAGAIVGAAYASGMTAAQVEAAARRVRLSSLIDFTFSSGGIMRGNKLADWVDTVTAGVPIERFPIRYAAVATELASEQPVALDRGGAGAAIQASAAVPGVTVPVRYAGGHLIDGGITSLVPVRFARAMGADLVIAVDVYCRSARGEGLGALGVLQRVMHAQSCLIAAAEMAEADILIAPALQGPGLSAQEEQEQAIEAGYAAARAALPHTLQVGGPHVPVQQAGELTIRRPEGQAAVGGDGAPVHRLLHRGR